MHSYCLRRLFGVPSIRSPVRPSFFSLKWLKSKRQRWKPELAGDDTWSIVPPPALSLLRYSAALIVSPKIVKHAPIGTPDDFVETKKTAEDRCRGQWMIRLCLPTCLAAATVNRGFGDPRTWKPATAQRNAGRRGILVACHHPHRERQLNAPRRTPGERS